MMFMLKLEQWKVDDELWFEPDDNGRYFRG